MLETTHPTNCQDGGNIGVQEGSSLVYLSPQNAFCDNSNLSICSSHECRGRNWTCNACQSSFSRDAGVLAPCTVFSTWPLFSACTPQGTGMDDRRGSCKAAVCYIASGHFGMAFLGEVFGYKGSFPMASLLRNDMVPIPAPLLYPCKKETQSSLLIIQGKELTESSKTAGEMSLNLSGWIKIGLLYSEAAT